MTVFEKLRLATEAAQNEQDLPDFLAARIFTIIENQDKFGGLETEVDELAEKVKIYDTYGQTGYLGMGVNNVILEKAIKRFDDRLPTPR
ncbi:MAG: hypothetical protein WDA20_14475 [Desulfuromonadales bacterium]